jgi:branched-chain amino acid transport system substrate-binding protein
VKTYLHGWTVRLTAALAAVGAVVVLAGLLSGPSTARNREVTARATAAGTSACGTKPGVAAKGSPINIGSINTHQPGTDFTDISTMEAAYFACVNANGGVNGHPLKLFAETDQTQPAQIAGDAKQLIQSDHVVAIVGVTDLLECTIDTPYWHKLGIFEIDSGIAPECWSTPNSAAVNMGPRYSSDGAVQYVIAHGAKKVVFVQSLVPGNGYVAGGPVAVANASHVPITTLTEPVPINDANSVALTLVNDAGPSGAVVLNFTPPEALVILKAVQTLGLENKVKSWGCSTPCNTDFIAQSLGPKWNHKLFVNAELTDPDDHNGPEMQLYKAMVAKYGKALSGGIGSFSQFGFVEAKFLLKALGTINGAYTLKSVNAAIEAAKNYTSEMLCSPWTYGKLSLHIPNNVDYTTTPEGGKMVTVEGCTAISNSDPQIAKYRAVAKAAGISPGG